MFSIHKLIIIDLEFVFHELYQNPDFLGWTHRQTIQFYSVFILSVNIATAIKTLNDMHNLHLGCIRKCVELYYWQP
jgi:hypothetical protein